VTWFLDKEFLEKVDLRAYDAAAIAKRLDLSQDIVAAAVDPARRYLVQSSEYGWLAGADGDHKPTLVFVGEPRLSGGDQAPINAVTFDLATGAITTRAIAFEGELEWDDVLDHLEEEIGFIHVGNAPVLAFVHPQLWHYAVVPFPFHIHDKVVGADDDDLDIAREWIEEGSFVVQCGNAYYLNAEGEVTSS
jgi:hypothetical protein